MFRIQFCLSGTGHLGIEDLARDCSAMRKMCASAKKAALRKMTVLAAALVMDIEPEPDDDEAPEGEGDDRLLTAAEAAPRTGLSKGALYRDKSLPFRVELSPGRIRFYSAGIAEWIRAKSAA
jgi:predicted DNA-binding transcriptional regulator AlpA